MLKHMCLVRAVIKCVFEPRGATMDLTEGEKVPRHFLQSSQWLSKFAFCVNHRIILFLFLRIIDGHKLYSVAAELVLKHVQILKFSTDFDYFWFD